MVKKWLILLLCIYLMYGCSSLYMQESRSFYYNLSEFTTLSDNITFDKLQQGKILYVSTYSNYTTEPFVNEFETVLRSEFLSFGYSFIRFHEKVDGETQEILSANQKLNNDYISKLSKQSNCRYICLANILHFGTSSTERFLQYSSIIGNIPTSYDNKSICVRFSIWDMKESIMILEKDIEHYSGELYLTPEKLYKKTIINFLNTLNMTKYSKSTQLTFNRLFNDYLEIRVSDLESMINELGGGLRNTKVDIVIEMDGKVTYIPRNSEYLDLEMKLKVRNILTNSLKLKNYEINPYMKT